SRPLTFWRGRYYSPASPSSTIRRTPGTPGPCVDDEDPCVAVRCRARHSRSRGTARTRVSEHARARAVERRAKRPRPRAAALEPEAGRRREGAFLGDGRRRLLQSQLVRRLGLLETDP